MTEDSIEADIKDTCSVTTSGAIHCHVNNGLMEVGFSRFVLKAEHLKWSAPYGYPPEFWCNGGRPYQSLPFLIQKINRTVELIWSHYPFLDTHGVLYVGNLNSVLLIGYLLKLSR